MLKPGMMLCDRYEILEVVGAGGMSIVYKAKCHRLNRNVAIKVLKPEFSNDKNFVTKFRIEAQASAGLSHPNIVNVYDVYDDEGIYFIVMELVEGITLKDYISEYGRLPMDKAIDFSMQIAAGLEAAHESHIIHRDIKPQNIIVAKNGTIKVTDFGIARAASPNTLTSGAVGSVHYISPEQARGGYSDERSDIYSLGITMYEMVTGRVPYDGDNNVSIALMHIQNEMISPRQYYPDIYSSFEKIIYKATQKKPERRYLTASALIADLRRVQNNPNIDIVVAATAVPNSPTQEWTKEDVKAIRQGSAAKDVSSEQSAGIPTVAPGVQQPVRPVGMQQPVRPAGMQQPVSPVGMQQPRPTNPYIQQVNPPVQNNMGEIKPNPGTISSIPVNNERINKLFYEEEYPWDEEDYEEEEDFEPIPQPTRKPVKTATIKKVQDDYDDYDDDYDDEDLDPNLKKGVMIAGVATAIVIAILLLIGFGKLTGLFKFGGKKADNKSTTETAKELVMPQVVNLSKEAAIEELKKAGFDMDINIEIQEVPIKTIEDGKNVTAGYVYEQSKGRGEKVESDEKVVIKVAVEGEPVVVPDVFNLTDSQATQMLQEKGFKVEHGYEFSDDVDTDKVIRTEPAANSQAVWGSSVKIIMSNGSEVKETTVPSIEGMSEAQAINALNNAKLKTGAATHEYHDTVKQGYVISQSLPKETKVKEDTEVSYVISDGPEPKDATYIAEIKGKVYAPADGSFDGQGVTVVVTFNGSPIYEGAIATVNSGSTYDVSASQSGLTSQSGTGGIIVKDANGNDVTQKFSASVSTSFKEDK